MSLHRNNSCANYIASESQDDVCAELLLSSELSALRSTLCLTQHESLILSRHPDTSAKTLSYPYPQCSSLIPQTLHTSTSVLELQSFSMSLVGLFITQARNYTAVI